MEGDSFGFPLSSSSIKRAFNKGIVNSKTVCNTEKHFRPVFGLKVHAMWLNQLVLLKRAETIHYVLISYPYFMATIIPGNTHTVERIFFDDIHSSSELALNPLASSQRVFISPFMRFIEFKNIEIFGNINDNISIQWLFKEPVSFIDRHKMSEGTMSSH